MKSKKKVLGISKVSFWVILLKGATAFLICLKRAFENSFGKRDLECASLSYNSKLKLIWPYEEITNDILRA